MIQQKKVVTSIGMNISTKGLPLIAVGLPIMLSKRLSKSCTSLSKIKDFNYKLSFFSVQHFVMSNQKCVVKLCSNTVLFSLGRLAQN